MDVVYQKSGMVPGVLTTLNGKLIQFIFYSIDSLINLKLSEGMVLFISEPNRHEVLGYLVKIDGLKMEFKNITTDGGKLYPNGQKKNWLKESEYPNSKRRVITIPFLH